MLNKPYAESCDQNREPILEVIEPVLRQKARVLEIGSGTGQHAVYFTGEMPHLYWQCSDQASCLQGINSWLQEAASDRLPPAIEIDVTNTPWNVAGIDAIFTANTVHIMNREEVLALLRGAAALLPESGVLLVYGPFNYNNDYTSESNRRFDQWLKARDGKSGIKDFEWLCEHAEKNAMRLVNDYEMPANNRILHFIRM